MDNDVGVFADAVLVELVQAASARSRANKAVTMITFFMSNSFHFLSYGMDLLLQLKHTRDMFGKCSGIWWI
jgi:hypothetical protein